MNGIHDMGGMHNFGPVEREEDEPVFHEPWEERAFALTLAMGAWKKWNIDGARHARELLPPADYLAMSYYERWIAVLIAQIVETGLAGPEELATGRPAPGSGKATPAIAARDVAESLRRGSLVLREVPAAPRFRVGQRVRARNMNPEGHTRLPRYVRGKTGTVARDHGVHVFPDSNAHLRGEKPQHLYNVRFAARELWGAEASAQDSVCLDLWEDHLEPT